MKMATVQSNYLPWRGYFGLINEVDLFIFYDDVKYTKGDWRNRNRIIGSGGPQWLTIPCGSNNGRLIHEVSLKETNWQEKHWRTLLHNYKQAPFFSEYKYFFEEIYLGRKWENLSELNQQTIRAISRELLKLETEFDDSRNFDIEGTKSERVLDLARKSGCSTYLSGPAAQDYLDVVDFYDSGIDLVWADYSLLKPYPQMSSTFDGNVSIIDLLFNVGPKAAEYCRLS